MPSLPQPLPVKTPSGKPRPLRPEGKSGASKTDLPSVKKDQVREHISKVFVYKLKKEDLEKYRPFSTSSIIRKVMSNCSWKLFPDMRITKGDWE